jgi:hypothetical protein
MTTPQRIALTIAVVVLGTSAAVGQVSRPRVHVPTIEPRPEDVSTIDGMIKAYYEVISGPAGKPRAWARDRTLYIKDLRFVAVDFDKSGNIRPRIQDHQAYVDASDGMTRRGFFEREIHRVTERFGPIAHVWSTYESRQKEDGPVIARGINSIELFWDGKRWWIANAIWTDERADLPIPSEYLPR